MSVYYYRNDTYSFYTYLIVCPPEEFVQTAIKSPVKLNKEDAQSFADKIEDGFAGYTVPLNYDGIDAYLIWLPEFNYTVDDYVYLAHEVSHVAFGALVHRGWKDFSNEDVQHSQMYLKDSIFKTFLNKLEEEKAKVKKTKSKKHK